MKEEKLDPKPIKKPKNFDWDLYWDRRATYHWQYFSDEDQHYYEYPLDECIEVRLFNNSENQPIDFYWKNTNWQQDLIGEYFHGAFEDWAFHRGARLKDLFTRLIIPQDKYYEILNKVKEFQLSHIQDLLLLTIAITQSIFSNEIRFWGTLESKKIISTAPSETEKVIKIIEQSGVHHKSVKSMRENPSKGLLNITFTFKDKSKLKLEHSWLMYEFVEHMMRYYDSLEHKDWRKDLSMYPGRFGNSYLKEGFKKQIIQAYYELFINNKWFVSKVKYPSIMMQCITCLLEFSLIPGAESRLSQSRRAKNVLESLRQIYGESES